MATAPEDNIFGKILRGELPSFEVFSDEKTFAFLDIYPQNPGHTLVIPRSFSPNLIEADSADVAACLETVRRIAPAIRSACDAEGISVLSNTGREAGQMIEYLHFHVIPRHSGDEISYYRLGKQEPPEVLIEIAERIRSLIR